MDDHVLTAAEKLLSHLCKFPPSPRIAVTHYVIWPGLLKSSPTMFRSLPLVPLAVSFDEQFATTNIMSLYTALQVGQQICLDMEKQRWATHFLECRYSMPRAQPKPNSTPLFRVGTPPLPELTCLNRSDMEPPGRNSVTIM